MEENYAPVDEKADAQLRKDALDEENSINTTAEKMGLSIHEVPHF